MSDIEEQLDDMDGFSLAELADLDVSDIAEVRYINLPRGKFDFEVVESKLESYESDGLQYHRVEYTLKIIEVKSVLDRMTPEQKEQLVGKTHTERFRIDPRASIEDTQKVIGRIRAFVTDIGLDSSGRVQDLVERPQGHTFTGKITKQKDRNDPTREYARLQLDQGVNK